MLGGARAIDLNSRIGNFCNGRRPISSLLTRMLVNCQLLTGIDDDMELMFRVLGCGDNCSVPEAWTSAQ